MKISLVVSDLSKQGAGRWGGAVRTFLLAKALKDLGHSIEIGGFICGEPPTNLPTDQYPIYTIKSKSYPQFFQASRDLFKQLSGEILYAIKLRPSSFGVCLSHRAGRKVIVDIDDWELSWYGGDNYQYRPNFRQLIRDIIKPTGALRTPDHPYYLKRIEHRIKEADLITVHTQFIQNRFGGTYIPNGKDTDLFNPDLYNPIESKARHQLTNYRVLMFPGAPRPYKGLEDILAALELLNQPDLRLVIVGGSPYDNYDQTLINRWNRWIIKLPSCHPTQMPDIIAAADIIVVPQRDTPSALAQFPLKLTDGMSMAKPILATKVGDIPTILQDTGTLVDPESPSQLADAITWIFNNPDIAISQAKRARIRCIEHYSIKAMSQILAQIIDPQIAV